MGGKLCNERGLYEEKNETVIILLLLFAILLVYYSRYIEPERLIVKEITVETNMEIETCRIVFFTDTHFGALYDEKHIERIVEMINGRDADIVIFGGDLLDNYTRDKEILDLEYLQEELSRIETKDGMYAVFGNHDYGGGAVRIYENFMNNCGFYVLDNETVFLERFNIEIIGFDDYLLGLTEEDLYYIQSIKGFYGTQDIDSESFAQLYVSSGIGLTKYPFRLFNVPEMIEVNLR